LCGKALGLGAKLKEKKKLAGGGGAKLKRKKKLWVNF
jgi:hypothetical protein